MKRLPLYKIEGYEIDENGTVYDLVKNKIVKPLPTELGLQYRLRGEKINDKTYRTKTKLGHRLMVETFFSHIKVKVIEFKDGNKLNICLENIICLEQKRASENHSKSVSTSREKNKMNDCCTAWMGTGFQV